MRIAVFDFEADGLLDTVTKLHCCWVINPNDPSQRVGYGPYDMDRCIKHLETFDILVGHNIVDFDLPLVKKFYPEFNPRGAFDTIVLSRMLSPARLQHGLDSYGKELGGDTGNVKGDYGKQENAWAEYNKEMFDYCEDDVKLNVDVYLHLCKLAGIDPLSPPFIEGKELE